MLICVMFESRLLALCLGQRGLRQSWCILHRTSTGIGSIFLSDSLQSLEKREYIRLLVVDVEYYHDAVQPSRMWLTNL